jgi:Ran GTPase-activating protein (RanGAP) involved in mRNA processing and transport
MLLSMYYSLSDTDISAESVSALASALCVNHSLKALDLSENRIPDAGVSLAGALRVNRSLENLDLSDTDLSAESVSALASALCVNHSLKALE